MISSALLELSQGIKDLEKYIRFNNLVNKALFEASSSNNFDNKTLEEIASLLTNFRRKRIFEYNAYIISLYGLFERYVENIIAEYLNVVTTLTDKYSEFNDTIKQNNRSLSIELLDNIDKPKYSSLTIEGVISNLHKAINENNPLINVVAFQHHAYNFRHKVIADSFKRLGIDGISMSLRSYSPLHETLTAIHGRVDHLESEVVFSKIDELAQRRNDVAHGVENIDILDSAIILEYIEFVQHYSDSLNSIALNEVYKSLFDANNVDVEVIKVIHPNILCFYIEKNDIKKGDKLLSKRNRQRPLNIKSMKSLKFR